MNTYQGLFILPSSLKDEAQEKTLARVEDEIKKLGGSVIRKDSMGKRMFARPMKKQETGVYVKMFLSLDPDKVSPLLNRLKFVDEVFRVQLVRKDPKTVEASEPASEPEAPAETAAEPTATAKAEA